ncbi:MAG: hypothetical protein O8C61_01280 [Candidatus Methanoperedens sp.]|nr:hypothetical protein [Candidatus Methanoperedens sp.]
MIKTRKTRPGKSIDSTILKKNRLKSLLFTSSFLTYGLGDGITAAYMMEKTGANIEANPLAKFMYVSYGSKGIVALKLWFTVVILSLVSTISKRTGAYWATNGFLFALTIGGLMATRANVLATLGMPFPSPGSIIFTFLFMVILFLEVGNLIDKLYSNDKPVSC